MRRLLALCAALLAIVMTLTACGDDSTKSTEPHNKADVTFAQHMIPHHEQAVQMSDIILGKQGIDPRVVNLANEIKAAQGPEIQQMQSWLSQWGEPTTAAASHHSMPGMVPDQAMAALRDAQGAEASKLFLNNMIGHHKGAIAMAQDEIKSGQYPPAVAMAHSIVTSQQKEITDLQGLLASL